MAVFDNWLVSLGVYRRDIVQPREVQFSHTLVFEDEDLTAAAFEGGVKAEPGQTSAALGSFTFGTPTLDSGDTTVVATMSQAIMDALPENTDAADPVELAYDIYVTPSGGNRELAMAGIFKVNAGVVQA
ncbi:MAG: hypothetical protein ABJC88_17015 [Parasphingorhabdus sp.]|uniref:hypothetical protein n=1 Tax=Sphingomonadales TaxID=204457 RepID=UPI003262CE3F